jgi:UDP-glucuronate decarboxylase
MDRYLLELLVKERMKKRILITGGAGFLGSHLCKRLLDDSCDVICVDNLFTGTKRNIQHLMNNPSFEFIRHDITFPLYVEVDEIYNLACPASPVHYQHNPVQTVKTNVHGSINMLGLAKRTKAKIFQASTSEVYGDPDIHPQTETYNGNVSCTGKRACYDEGKRCAETLFYDYHRQYGVDVRVARIFNTYGPKMQVNDGRVISNFIVQALNNKPITIYGDGTQTRSFCYVDDLINGIVNLMDSDYSKPVNLGNPNEVSIIYIARKIMDITKSKAEIELVKLPEDDPKRRKPDISIAERLGWIPAVSLEEGLNNTIGYFKSL